MNFELRHFFPCDTETLWAVIHDPAFQAAATQGAEVDRETLEDRTVAGIRTLRVRYKLHKPLPTPVARALGAEKLSYVMEQRWALNPPQHMRWTLTPDVGAERVRCRGEFKVQSLGDDECERLITGELKISIPIVGGKIEERVIEEVKASYVRSAATLREWVIRRKTEGAP